MTAPSPAPRSHARLALTCFFLGLIAACGLLTFGVTTKLNQTREEMVDWNPGYKVIAVLHGDLIEVTDYETTNRVKLLGLQCPPTDRESELDAQSRQLAIPAEELLQQGQTARDTLLAWIYRRQIQVTFRDQETETLEDGTWWAYGSVAGVDIGRKMLMGGQARLDGTDHPRRAEYAAYADSAKAKQIGIWRTGEPVNAPRRLAAAAMVLAPLLVLAVLLGRRCNRTAA